MLFSTSAVLASTVSIVLATSIPKEGRIPPTNGVLTYVGPITPGGEDHIINGTANAIIAEIKKRNPSFNADDWQHLREAKDRRVKRGIERRWAGLGPENCGTYGYALEETGLILPLYGMPGQCTMGGAGSGGPLCVQLTCYSEDSQDNAVTWCNNGSNDLSYDCLLLAEYASDIGQQCTQTSSDKRSTLGARGAVPLDLVGGQEFSSADWNVIIGIPSGGCSNPMLNGGSPTYDYTGTFTYSPTTATNDPAGVSPA